MGKKEWESTLPILQDCLSEVTSALQTLMHFLQVMTGVKLFLFS